MKFICAQPAIDYYTWQVEVMINNFIQQGVNANSIEILCSYTSVIPQNWRKLADTYNNVRFFFYKDERQRASYISSIRPHVLHQHWLHHPELANETIFYHDCDILLSKPVDFNNLLQDDICYVSDTVSYIGAEYVRSKGEQYLDLMMSIVGVDKTFVIGNEKNSGGAQYIIKNVTAEFWSKVYHDSEKLWRMVNDMIKREKPPHALQIWCADMWAVLWNLWFFDKKVKVAEEMSFSWGTSNISDWDKHKIYHNAGVTADRKDLFFKGAYQSKTPYDMDLSTINDKYCVYNYAKEILNTSLITCLTK